ncbi:hypothetical protein LLH00_16690 [bacterium]|nr:hypothetical protein [bacterium]
MQERDINGILQKVEELKSVFSFGVRFLPFLEDLLVFVQEMAPMLNEMNQSIQDSSSKMPKAVQQLDKVTSATELATNEILDKVDSMLGRLDQVTTNFNVVRERLSAEQTALSGIAGAIEELLELPGVREGLNRVFEDEKARQKGVEIKKIVDEFLSGKIGEDVPQSVENLLQDTQTDAYDIMNALQVQDITAQQIEGAHGLLRSVQERLNMLITKYSEAEPPAIFREAKAHDINAIFDMDDDRQKAVDEVLGQSPENLLAESEPAPAEASDESDLPASSAFDESLPEAVEAEAEAEVAGEEPNQAEIDELLSWGDGGANAALPGEETAALDEQAADEMSAEDLLAGADLTAVEPEQVEEPLLEEVIPADSGNGKLEEVVVEEPEVPKAKKGQGKNEKPAKEKEDGAASIKISQEEIDKLFS